MKKNFLVTGAGGFIGGHQVKKLLSLKYDEIAVDIKTKKYWFQSFKKTKNLSLDLKRIQKFLKNYKECNLCNEFSM